MTRRAPDRAQTISELLNQYELFAALLAGDAYVHGDDLRASLRLPFDTGPGLYASLDFVLGALERDDVASTDPRIMRLLPIPAHEFASATGIDSHDFVLAASGRLDGARLDLPESINIYR